MLSYAKDHLPMFIMNQLGSLEMKLTWLYYDANWAKWVDCIMMLMELNGAEKVSKVSWEQVWLPKKEGGLGLKRVENWNKTVMVKHIWNLFTQVGSLWVAWMYGELLKGMSLWTSRSHCSRFLGHDVCHFCHPLGRVWGFVV